MWNYRTADSLNYKILKEYAIQNRNNMTEAESVIWNIVKAKKLGVKFLRQHIIGNYIVDFVCQENGLVIEVDGGYHSEPKQQEDDAIRTAFLSEQGFNVIRFTNEEVLFNIEYVINEITRNIQ